MDLGFFKIVGRGKVTSIDFNDKSAKLQFLTLKDNKKGMQIFDVKVEGAKVEDLEQFVGKVVELDDLKIVQVDFQKFYKVDDVSKIKILENGAKK